MSVSLISREDGNILKLKDVQKQQRKSKHHVILERSKLRSLVRCRVKTGTVAGTRSWVSQGLVVWGGRFGRTVPHEILDARKIGSVVDLVFKTNITWS